MKPPSEMTDSELADAIAIEVLGWKLVQEPISVWLRYSPPRAPSNKRVPAAIEFFWQDTKGNKIISFDPLHDHNHAAIPRAKMRERGYSFSRDDVANRDGSLFDEGPHETTIGKSGMFVCCVAGKNELRAECEAMVEAARKDTK